MTNFITHLPNYRVGLSRWATTKKKTKVGGGHAFQIDMHGQGELEAAEVVKCIREWILKKCTELCTGPTSPQLVLGLIQVPHMI